MEIDIALEYDGAGMPYASGHNQFAATFLDKGIDGLGKGFGTEGLAVAFGSKVADLYLIVGKHGG